MSDTIRDEAIENLEKENIEIVHADPELTRAHGHYGLCCCTLVFCASTACTLNAEIMTIIGNILHARSE